MAEGHQKKKGKEKPIWESFQKIAVPLEKKNNM